LKYFSILLLFVFIFSCDKKQETTTQQEDSKPLLSVENEFSSVKGINPIFRKDVEEWKELNAVTDFLERFKKASPKEVLSNALELKGLVESLKDSIKPVIFNASSFDARINIFYNETLRLADMTTIPAIQAQEVNVQTEKILEAFSAVNAKVNTILSKKRFEDEIDIDVSFIGLDSTKIDSISKKAINQQLQNRKINKKEDLELQKNQ
tara:strand:+ start:2169 stop:2792 length:624 start_codon:yes stop_codon:yes gene_type:complete